MKNGIYKASFQTPLGQGTGVVVINDGTIKGGDATMYYNGTFQKVGNQVTATLHVGQHTNIPGHSSVFGQNDVNVKLQGASTDTTATIQGTAAEAPGVQFRAQLSLIVG